MLVKYQHANGVILYRSQQLAQLGVPHAFSTRIGGVKESPRSTLDFGSPTTAQSSLELLRQAIGANDWPAAKVRQVHGADVCAITSANAALAMDGDALVTREAGVLLLVRVADCVPVLVARQNGNGDIEAVGAIHAGWRGLIAGVIPNAVAVLQNPDRLLAAIGPCISAAHYEVGPEVASQFAACGLAQAILPTPGKPHLDLRLAAKLQLTRAGVPPTQIDISDRCTFRDHDEFFSHRRDAGPGRMVAVIGFGDVAI